ncbi:MAG: exo-alpha-sialidase [Ignavibacteria bacterium]|nr:exo-alpha-sialidase [Ignavibacteria bacterium]
MFKLSILLILTICISEINALSQTASDLNTQRSIKNLIRATPEQIFKAQKVQNAIREIIQEKTRFSREEIKKALENSTIDGKYLPKDSLSTYLPNIDLNVKQEQLLINSETIVSDDPSAESELHAAINPTDSSNLIVSPIRSTTNPLEGLSCPIYYSKDFGKTWRKSSFQTRPINPSALIIGGGDPMFAFDAAGKLYMSWINLFIVNFSFDSIYVEMSWAYSLNGGESWSREASGVIGKAALAGANLTEFFDKQWMVVDQTNSPFRGNLYAGLFHPSGSDNRIGLRRKKANSKEFEQKTTRPLDNDYTLNQFTNVDIDLQGGVHLTFFGDKNNALKPALYHTISTDGGSTLLKEIKIADVQIPRFSGEQVDDSIVGVQASRLYPCPRFVIDKSTVSTYKGNCYMVWTANGVTSKEKNGLDIYFSSSIDNGSTWSTPRIVNDDTKGIQSEQFYPSITVNKNGVICLAWYDRRNDPSNLNTEYYMTFSFDGGKSFIKNFAVSHKPTDFSTVGLLNGGFGVGEYNEILSTENYAIPFWADARNNDGDMNVYSAYVPISSVTEVAETITTLNPKFELYDATPNPSYGSPQFRFRIDTPSQVKLELIDLSGSTTAILFNGIASPGENFITTPVGLLLNGSYRYKLTTDYGYSIKSLIIIK